uniref:BED-type domain-containing protein n=1 Tax=Caenorhabditis tropicalis TaxID=1561998 RepID=A0A1I7UVS9_9PELO
MSRWNVLLLLLFFLNWEQFPPKKSGMNMLFCGKCQMSHDKWKCQYDVRSYVLDPNALMSLHRHHHAPPPPPHPNQQPPTYEDSIKSHSPPKYDMTPATTNCE